MNENGYIYYYYFNGNCSVNKYYLKCTCPNCLGKAYIDRMNKKFVKNR